MLPSVEFLRRRLEEVIACKAAQGHDTGGLLAELKRLADSYDAIAAVARRLRDLPLRKDWPYEEPNDLPAIWAACDPSRPAGLLGGASAREIPSRIETAFLSAVCGCMLGKPLEIDPTLAEIRRAAAAVGDWPIRDYIREPLLEQLGRRHPDWHHTTRGRIAYVAPDDDINYTIIGMLVLEAKGVGFTHQDLASLWLQNLPPMAAWGANTVLSRTFPAGLISPCETGNFVQDDFNLTPFSSDSCRNQPRFLRELLLFGVKGVNNDFSNEKLE